MLFRSNDIVVATPGRIRDVLENEEDIAQVLKTASHVRTRYIDGLLNEPECLSFLSLF